MEEIVQDLDAPCYCGSGKRYKDCHKILHSALPSRHLDTARKFYVDRWVKNASAHVANGDYEWMIEQLPANATKVLDIGIGEGSGVDAILRVLSPAKVVALEENPECTRRALNKLHGVEGGAGTIERLKVARAGPGRREYSMSFSSGPVIADKRVTIVATDPLFDENLAGDLATIGEFDLVTGWLIGSHEAREYCENVRVLDVSSAAQYRLRVQNAIYELADAVLAVGGRLQIVDRVQYHDLEELRAEFHRSHGEQAAPTRLTVESVVFREYQEAKGSRVTMLLQNSGAGIPIDTTQTTYLASIVSIKTCG